MNTWEKGAGMLDMDEVINIDQIKKLIHIVHLFC